MSSFICKLLDSFATEAIHRLSYFSPLTQSKAKTANALDYYVLSNYPDFVIHTFRNSDTYCSDTSTIT